MKTLGKALDGWIQNHHEEVDLARRISAATEHLYRLAPKVPLWNVIVGVVLGKAGAGETAEQVFTELAAQSLLGGENASAQGVLTADWESVRTTAELIGTTRRPKKELEMVLEIASRPFAEAISDHPRTAVEAWKRAAAVLPYEVGSIVLPLAEQRALAPGDAEVLLRGLGGLSAKSPKLFVPAEKYVYKLSLDASTPWLRWIVYAPLLGETGFLDADFAYATEHLSLEDVARLSLALCDGRHRLGKSLGDPFYWVSLADQVSGGRYQRRNPVDDVLQAHSLLENLVVEGRVKDPAPLVERLVDVQVGRQLQGLVLDLRRAARTSNIPELLRGLVEEPTQRARATRRRRPKETAKRPTRSLPRSLSDEDVLTLKRVLTAAEESEDDPGSLKLLVARLESVAIHVYNEKGTKHHRPHFHAYRNGEDVAVVFIDRVEFDVCALARKAKQGLYDWAVTHQAQLLAAWDIASSGGTPLRIDR